MQTYLLRKGHSEGAHLSHEGRQSIRAIGTKIAKAFAPDYAYVVVSPEPSCVQSAEIFAERTSYLGVIEVWRELAVGVPAEVLGKRIAALGKDATQRGIAEPCVLVVGEEPWLSGLGAALIGRPTFPPPVYAQVSVIVNGRPTWFFRHSAEAHAPLLVA